MSLILNGDTGISAVDGTASAPALVGNDTDTGVYFSAANTLDFATAGTRRASINSTGDLQFNSGYGSVATAYGCRAWVNFNAVGTVTIRASGNVSSISDNGVGLFTVNFTNAMPDTSYSAVASTRRNTTSGGSGENNVNNGVNFRGGSTYSTAFTTSAVQICTGTVTNEALNDFDYVAVQIFR
jgi:hypothetical protein